MSELTKSLTTEDFAEIHIGIPGDKKERIKELIENMLNLADVRYFIRDEADDESVSLEEVFPDLHAGSAIRGLRHREEMTLRELAESGTKHTAEDIVRIARRATDGKIIFIEKGNRRAGLRHILERHAEDFAGQGFSSEEIPDIVIKAATEGTIVGCQRTRPIYETEIEGNRYHIAVTVGSNGFVVGANPISFP